MVNDVTRLLACPECEGPLQTRPYDNYFCPAGNSFYSVTLGIPNLLPTHLTKEVYSKGAQDLVTRITDPEDLELTLSADYVLCLLNDVSLGRMREADDHIATLIATQLPRECYTAKGRLTPGGVFLVSAAFQNLFEEYGERIPHAEATFTGLVGQARYEAELQATGDYRGNFVVPDGVLEHLPREGVIVEMGMGNGANLRRVAEVGDYDLLGFDYCYGMVQAARSYDGSDTFHAVADAHFAPLAADSVDVAFMLNALDRLPDPQRALERMKRYLKSGAIVVLGNCMPLQYDFTVGDKEVSTVPEHARFDTVDDAVTAMDADIIHVERGIEWHPETVTQGRENLDVDVVVGKVPE